MKRTPLKRGTKGLKRTGFKRPSYQEALAKKRELAPKLNEDQLFRKKKVAKGKPKHPTICGIKSTGRWVGPIGTLWTIFSMYVRLRDFNKYNGRCVSCPMVVPHWRDFDAGHYISVARGNNSTVMHPKNVNGQCKSCNNPDLTPDASIPYRAELERRWGEGTADELWDLLNVSVQAMSEIEIYREIDRYKKLFLELGGEL
jgi:hypothetical protein